jgi:hypothetical protein
VIPDGHVFTQPWPAGPKDKRRDQVIYYSYKADRARRTLHGIDEQVAKAAKAVAGLAPVKRNRFIALDGATKSVNRELEAKARDLAGLKGYITNLAACPDGTPVTADFVISSYRRLFEIEKSFRMSKHDLLGRTQINQPPMRSGSWLTMRACFWTSRHRPTRGASTAAVTSTAPLDPSGETILRSYMLSLEPSSCSSTLEPGRAASMHVFASARHCGPSP